MRLLLTLSFINSLFISQSLFAANLFSPAEYFKHELGSQHLRFDQIDNYVTYLAEQSDKIKQINYGETNENRQLNLTVISSAKNIQQLDKLRIQHEQLSNPFATQLNTRNMPVFIWLSFSSHGDEPSGAHAAIQLLYQLAHSDNKETQDWLNHSVILMDIVANPDGYDHFASWANQHYSRFPTGDRQHRAHSEHWPTGRGNHYGFDLNRDWLPITQIESQAKVSQYHKWKPNLLADFHEMQADHSYFFQPGVPERVNPLTPIENIALTKELSDYTARSFDQQGKLYFSEERFDDFYIGKASTYPDVQGGLGILLEQASSLGQVLDTQFGQLTFKKTIENQLLGAVSMLRAANAKREKLLDLQQNFFKQSIKQAKKDDISGYIINEPNNLTKLNQLLWVLKQHQIQAFPLTEDFKAEGKIYLKEDSYWIPLVQAQYNLIKSIFTTQDQFNDHVFYDVTNWNLPLAYGIDYHPIGDRLFGVKASKQAWQQASQVKANHLNPKAIAWILDWKDMLAPKMLSELLKLDFTVRVTEKKITAVTENGSQTFNAGSLLIIRSENQNKTSKQLESLLNLYPITHANILTGHTPEGPDLGSAYQVKLSLPKVAMLTDNGISPLETGQIWFHFDTQLNLPISQLDLFKINDYVLTNYTHLILVDGDYSSLSKKFINRLKLWIEQGGTLITQKRGSVWASQHGFIQNEFLSQRDLDSAFHRDDYRYQDQENYLAERMITGTVFKLKLDTSHPLALGYQKNNINVFRNDRVMLMEAGDPFHDVAKYTKDPLLAGYASPENIRLVANTAALTSYKLGQGQVIAFSDDPLYRAYWYATSRLFTNSLFFSHLIDFTH